MASNKMMEGKVVVVSGAGRGIGAAIARLMAQHGAKVVVNDIGVSLDGSGGDATPAQETVNEIRKTGGEAVANYDSVAEFQSAARIIPEFTVNVAPTAIETSAAGFISLIELTEVLVSTS